MIQTDKGFNKIQKGDYVKAALSDENSAFNANVDKTEEMFDEVITGKANVSSVHNLTLLKGEWVGGEIPYTYEISLAEITDDSIQEISLAAAASYEQIEVWNLAGLTDAGQQAGLMRIRSYGFKPQIDLPVVVVIRGDVF